MGDANFSVHTELVKELVKMVGGGFVGVFLFVCLGFGWLLAGYLFFCMYFLT